MIKKIKEILDSHGIEYCGVIPIEECSIINRSLFDRYANFATNAIVFLIPYRTKHPSTHNISLYAAAKDYHTYAKMLFKKICQQLEIILPDNHFHGMCDHSPIDETLAAATVGLGIIGDNGRLINDKYGSYVFIAEIYTDALIEASRIIQPFHCNSCGKCKECCPTAFNGECLSAITQKKGELCDFEITMIQKHGTLWGCDICQEACPLNEGKAFSEIDFFKDDLIFNLNEKILSSMSNEEFSERAFAWRGRKTVERNIKILETE